MITSEQLRDIKELSLKQYRSVYLCNVADDLGIRKEFQDYLLSNLDNTMTESRWDSDLNPPLWSDGDLNSRLNWLDKHIKLLEDDNK